MKKNSSINDVEKQLSDNKNEFIEMHASLLIQIIDPGMGISEETLNYFFLEFDQIDKKFSFEN